MAKLTTIHALFALVFWASPLFAEPYTTSFTQWVLHSDASMDTKATKLRELVHNHPEVFGNAGYLTDMVPMEATLPEFEAKIDQGLKLLKGQPNPLFILSLVSHGDHFKVCRDGACGKYSLENIALILRRQLSRRLTNGVAFPTLIIYDACFSGTLISVLDEVFPQGMRDRFPLTVLTSAPAERPSHGSLLVKGLANSVELLGRAEVSGPILPGYSPIEKVAMLTSNFDISKMDEPTCWSSSRSLDTWDAHSLSRIMDSAVVPTNLSRNVLSQFKRDRRAAAEFPRFSVFLKRTGRFSGPATMAAYQIESSLEEERPAKILQWAFDKTSMTHEARAALIVWAEGLPKGYVDKAALHAGERERWAEDFSYQEQKYLVVRDIAPARPGRFKSFEDFLLKIDKFDASSVRTLLVLDRAAPDELEKAIHSVIEAAPKGSRLPILVSIWAQFLPREWVSQKQVGEWEREFRQRTSMEEHDYFIQRASVEAGVYALTQDLEGLIALYSTTPRHTETGAEEPTHKVVRVRLAKYICDHNIGTPEAIAVLGSIMEDGYRITLAQLDHWLRSPHAHLTDKILSLAVENGWTEKLSEPDRKRAAAVCWRVNRAS